MSFRKFCFFLYVPLAITAFLTVERLCHLATDGFSVARISHNLDTPPPSTSPLSADLSEILSQPFTYLASGAQSYVFASQDGRYVIKFFKFHHLRIPQWLNALPTPSFLQAYKRKKIQKKQRALKKHFESYEIAASLLQKETALIALHLYATTDLHSSIHLIDKIGIHYVLDANSLAFVIQRKGVSFYEALLKDIESNQLLQAKERLSHLLQLSITRCQKGVGDLDPDFSTNFGVIDGEIAELDTGRFYLEESEKDPEVYKRELYRITRPLHKWLEEHSPELLSYLDEELSCIKGDAVF